MEATAAVHSSADAVGHMLAPSGTTDGGCLALTNGGVEARGGGGPSLEALVNVMTNSQQVPGTPATAAAKPKAKPKAKASSKSTSMQNAKTPAEVKDAIRNPIQIKLELLYICTKNGPYLLSSFYGLWNALFN